MNRNGPNDKWEKAKRLCQLSEDETRMARELGIGPRALIKNIASPSPLWKAPAPVWIRNSYAKRLKKSIPGESNALPGAVEPREQIPESEFEDSFDV